MKRVNFVSVTAFCLFVACALLCGCSGKTGSIDSECSKILSSPGDTMLAGFIYYEFQRNEITATEKYTNKHLVIQGMVLKVEKVGESAKITVEAAEGTAMICLMANSEFSKAKSITAGNTATISGVFVKWNNGSGTMQCCSLLPNFDFY